MRQIIRVMVATVFLGGLLGCATTTWTHPTKNRQDYYSDRLYCEQMANQLAYQAYPLPPASIKIKINNSNNSNGLWGLVAPNDDGCDKLKNAMSDLNRTMNDLNRDVYRDRIFEQCMYSKGWHKGK